MTLLHVLYAIGGICVIVFLHELGHFLAAKRVGVRVERFFLGFDPWNLRLFSFRVGETLYGIGLLPLGGYVKLADESPEEAGRPPSPNGLLAKPPGARALILVAGSFMNLLSGFVFFIVAFTIGVHFTSPEVGSVVPGSPAWTAGLKEGDRVTALGDDPVTDFFELRLGVALAERGKPLRVEVSRPVEGDGRTQAACFDVKPRWHAEGFNEIGVLPATSPVLGPPKPGSALAKAGLRAGDRLLGAEVGGVELPPLPVAALLDALQSYLRRRPSDPVRVRIERDGRTFWQTIALVPEPKPRSRPQIGVGPGLGNVVRGIRPGSPAAEVFRAGDRLVRVNGKAVTTVEPTAPLTSWRGPEGLLDLTIARATGQAGAPEPVVLRVEPLALVAWTVRGDIHWGEHTLRVDELQPGSPLEAAGLRPGDVVTHVDGTPCFDDDELREALDARRSDNCRIRVLRGEEPVEFEVPRADLKKSGAVKWRALPALGNVVAGGPAAAAGVAEGSILLELGSARLRSWGDLTDRIAKAKPGESLAARWVDPEGRTVEGTLAPARPAYAPLELPLNPVEFRVVAGPIESVSLGARRTILVSKQVFLMLRSLVRRDVSAKNLAGPIGIVHSFTVILEHGPLSQLIYWLALISVNLGLLNLLPIPILDGGQILFVAIEKVKGSAVDERVKALATNVALALLLALFIFVTFHDIRRILL
ncbi:MAG: RIP metalloprotease RseP [Planctomycetota bacterium]